MSQLDTAFAPTDPVLETEHDFTLTLLPSVDRLRVLVADPDPLARRALTDSLREDGAFTVIGQATDGVEAIELARHYAPDVVLLATHLPRTDSIAVCERIVASHVSTRVVM